MKIKLIALIMIISSILLGQDMLQSGSAEFLTVNSDSLLKVAQNQYQMAEYEKAADSYRTYLWNHIDDAGNIYNLACCYGLMGNEENAAEYLKIAYDKGYQHLDHIKQDSDFDQVKSGEIFTKLIQTFEKNTKPETQTRELVSGISYSPYLLRLPQDFDTNKKYPLIIALHGYGHNAPVFSVLFENSNAIVATPETSYPFDLGGATGYSWSVDILDDEIRNESFWQSAQTTAQIIVQLKKKYNVEKVMVMGFSQGGGLSYLVGLSHPELVDMIVPFGGFYPADLISVEMLAKAKKNKFEVFIGHGAEDQTVSVEEAEVAEKALQETGLKVETHFYEGGHRVDRGTLKKAVDMFESM